MDTNEVTPPQDGDEIDFSARYKVAGYGGVAFYLTGYRKWKGDDWIWSGYENVDYDQVCAIMVGDDRVHIVDVNDLEVIADEDYCHECGQIGCTADGR